MTSANPTPLHGRDGELSAARELLRGVLAGRTTTLLVTGEIGGGKSALLTAIADEARDLGFPVATAAGARLESDLRGGVVGRLGEGLHDGPAESLDWFYRVVREALGRGPLLLVVDDVDLSDSWSLRCLAYVLRRVADQPLAVVLGATTGQPPLGDVTLSELVGMHHEHIELAGLDVTAVAALVGDAPASVCRDVTGGNPGLLAALADQIPTAADVRTLGSADIGAALRVRLRRYGGAVEAVRAAAVLGEDATVDRLAAMAGVEPRSGLRIIDGLVRLHVFRDDYPLGFVHPYLRNSVLADVPVATRAADHARAAVLLRDAGAPDERIAEHLREAPAVPLPWGVEILRRAAREAIYDDRLDAAQDYLERALEERLSSDERLAVQLELVHVTFLVDQEAGMARLRDALAHADDARSAAGQAVTMLLRLCSGPEARLAVSIGLQLASRLTSQEHDESWELRVMAYLASAGNDVALALRASMFTDELESEVPHSPRLRQVHSAFLSLGHALRGESAEDALRYAAEALEGERVDVFVQPFVFTVSTCFMADAPELSDRFRRMIGSETEPHDYHLRKGTVVSMAHGMDFLARGDLVRAKTFLKWQLRLFDELGSVAVCPMAILCAARLAEVLVDLGRFEEARDLVARYGFADDLPELFQHNLTLYARGKLKLALDDPRGALADLLECGRRLGASKIDSPAILPWRAPAVRAHLALGRREAAVRLAAEDLARAKRWGTPRAMGTALISVGLTADDDAATRALAKAVEYLTESVARLLHAEALLELGAQLRRRGRAERAIPHLRQAVELSARCESKPLIRRAAEELRACEPATAHGTVHGLTKQETRVAGMAAQGLTNRQIAEALFLTRRTVELHLSGAYRKLGIAGRADLAGALRRQGQYSA
ncbi:DNA-binding NarL/FixJ family response regulator [Saccharothrix ecbatanensis]|uniref:DNA-binding NarL/FixJ family response regulator n=1 Tax=Saccharothrix ecbatanensis TaxID=1105145 RepID=A0A7W9HTK7_9PSEU|nr:LuxR family transcriptional regulator [Saccharothrix ecbatanensis]MBB5808245.1 DNA-binding NarL/FixJ family response regulator [Saccharothrix ecbatanensis]